jgi:hypothetical protein
MSELIPVAKGDEYHEVHPTTLAGHKAVGFVECARREVAADEAKPLGIAELRDTLTARGIEFDPAAKKADLQALLDAAG